MPKYCVELIKDPDVTSVRKVVKLFVTEADTPEEAEIKSYKDQDFNTYRTLIGYKIETRELNPASTENSLEGRVDQSPLP